MSRTANVDGVSFKDHFSSHARSYAAHRPGYPPSLFSWLASVCRRHNLAWDCATGNGQAAHSLVAWFDKVLATDASEKQIASAAPHPKIEFRVAAAESSGIDAGSVDLITVAQALHWFDIEAFFAEACRVLKPGGILAIWSYARCHVTPECDKIIDKLFTETDSYWPRERRLVDDHYRGISLPVPEIPCESIEMQLDWTAAELLDYMRTWSGSQRYRNATGRDPVANFEREFKTAWGEGTRRVTWPLTLRVGQKRHGVDA